MLKTCCTEETMFNTRNTTKSSYIIGVFYLLAVVKSNATFVSQFTCESRNLTITVDDNFTIYFDGVEITNLPNTMFWNVPDVIDLPCTTRLIAVHGINQYVGGLAGILASTDDDYVLTNSSWKCSNESQLGWEEIDFDDSAWPSAVEFGSNENSLWNFTDGISSNAAWIWHENMDSDAYCRSKLDPNLCVLRSPCQFGATCIDEPNGGYKCICAPGYAGQNCSFDNDECVDRTHNCSDECRNTKGSYECRCPKDYRLQLDNQTFEAQDSMTEVTGNVPLIAATGALALLPIAAAVIVSIILVRRRRRTKQIEEVGMPPKDEFAKAAVDNATYESLEISDVNGGKNHIYEPVAKTPHAENANYEDLL